MGRDEAVENLLASGVDTTIRGYDTRFPYNYACIAAERDANFPKSRNISNKIRDLLDPFKARHAKGLQIKKV